MIFEVSLLAIFVGGILIGIAIKTLIDVERERKRMSKIEVAEPTFVPDRGELILPCDCGCSLVTIAVWEEDEDWKEYTYVDFYTSHGRNQGFREKLKTIWNIIRNKENIYHGAVWQGKQLEQLQEWLTERVESQDTIHRLSQSRMEYLDRCNTYEKALRRIEKKHVLEPQAARIARAALEGEDDE